MDQRRLIIVSGLSGAGKTVVLNTLEDMSFYTIDNLPTSLLNVFIEQLKDPENASSNKIAIGVDARNSRDDLLCLPQNLHELKKHNVNTEIIFIEADDDVLTKRFSETRRKHPLSNDKVALIDAIKQEHDAIDVLSENADLRIDTSYMQIQELRQIINHRIGDRDTKALSLQIISFGFKNGIPKDADFVFDCRCLPNPYWNKNLREFSGKDQAVIEFLSSHESVNELFSDIKHFLEVWIPRFEKDNRSYLTIAIGCTGGHHRSVFIAEKLTEALKNHGKKIILRHRDI